MNSPTTHISALTQGARPDVVSAIRQASAQTGVDFAYLLEKAAAESSLNPQAQAETSSARGLYQFIDKTWLDTMDKHGAAHGYPNAANAIKRDSDGNPVIGDVKAKEYILSLRDNPRISALMAGEFAQDNRQTLEHSLGRQVGNAELYMAHFLGAEGAAKFLNTLETNPDSAAASIVPAAARANQNVFYDEGMALSVDQVFARLAGKFQEPPAGPSPPALAVTPKDASPEAENIPHTLATLAGLDTTPKAAIIAASDPALAALRMSHAALSQPERGLQTSLRADVATQMLTLNLLQAFNQGEDDKPNEWVV